MKISPASRGGRARLRGSRPRKEVRDTAGTRQTHTPRTRTQSPKLYYQIDVICELMYPMSALNIAIVGLLCTWEVYVQPS